tara:strand:- start:16368 stop:17072 length:705 start_codon:yes stop_codon:yes gene_type:complete
MIYKKLIAVSLFCTVLNNSYGLTNKIKTVTYSPNNIIKLSSDTLLQTMIELNKNEDIQNISIGDSTAWNVNVPKNTPNIIFVKPNMINSNTNMTVITDKNTYHFDLSSNEIDKNNAIYHLKFHYPNITNNLSYINYKNNHYYKNNPDGWNWQYSFIGNKNIAPKLIFDDKEKFTYFKFNPTQEAPAIYINNNGKDELVNYKVKSPYIVIEKLARKFTIRYGNQITHIYNEQGKV